MTSPLQFLNAHFAAAFAACGLEAKWGKVTPSDRPDLAQFQCNGALGAAKAAKANPRAVAEQVLAKAAHPDLTLAIAGPGFININFTNIALVGYVEAMAKAKKWGLPEPQKKENYLIEYASPNIAKAMHVGHLRSGVIGDTLSRLVRFIGHEVVSINHWGDWGTPMGMVLLGLEREKITAEQITVEKLADLYPKISAACKDDPALREQAKAITVKLQNGDPHYRALWQKMVELSKERAREEFKDLNIEIKVMRGESDAHEAIAPLVKELRAKGLAVESDGALVVPMDDDKTPPLILYKSDGGVMYGTTDLATIATRIQGVPFSDEPPDNQAPYAFRPKHIWYVVDHRQSLHFKQVFSAAQKAGLLGKVQVEHLAFGTMNGPDGKPFKTRDGGVLQLSDLIKQVMRKAKERFAENGAVLPPLIQGWTIEKQVAVATLRFADLSVHRTSDYIFDMDKFSSFEGKTGPYLQYTAVRIQSMLDKAKAQGLQAGDLVAPTTAAERDLLLALTRLPEVVQLAFAERAPNIICDQAFGLAQAYSRFYNECHILTEANAGKQAGWLALSAMTLQQLKVLLTDILGIDVPAKM